MRRRYVVGLTGGIGSGKSEVANGFVALGVDVADADTAAHAVTARDAPGYSAVIAAFGPEAVGARGELDRAWLRKLVFANPLARLELERILHPLIHEHLNGEVAAWRGPYGLLSVPLLLERKTLLPLVARVLVVDCAEDEQVRRVVRRSGMAPDEVRAIMAAQVSRPERLAAADDVIDNNGPREALEPQIARLDAFYRQQAASIESLESTAGSPDNSQKRPQSRT